MKDYVGQFRKNFKTDRGNIRRFQSFARPTSFSASDCSYSENLPPIKTSLENILVVNSAQIANGTLNVNKTTQLAKNFFDNYLSD